MKTEKEIEDILDESLEELRAKRQTSVDANAVCNHVGKKIALAKMRLIYAKQHGRVAPKIAWLEDEK